MIWLWQAFLTVIGWFVELFFGDYIKEKIATMMATILAFIAAILGLVIPHDGLLALKSNSEIDAQAVHDYLTLVDKSSVKLSYDGKAVANKHGVQLNHDSKGEPEWAMGRSCDVLSYRTGKTGKWAVGRHVWVVVFNEDKVFFKKSSLPKAVDTKMRENCTVIAQ